MSQIEKQDQLNQQTEDKKEKQDQMMDLPKIHGNSQDQVNPMSAPPKKTK